MLTVEECRKYLKNPSLKDEEIITVRNFLYALSERVIRTGIQKNDQSSQKDTMGNNIL